MKNLTPCVFLFANLTEDVLDHGIHSIPTTIVDGQYVLNGAVRADEILDVFNRLIRENSLSGSRVFTV